MYIHFGKHMLWKTHIDTIGSKLAKSSGVLNKLKCYLPEYVLRTVHFGMVQLRLTYGILAYGFYHYHLEKILNRIIRIISLSKFIAPTKPTFKAFDLITMNDLFSLNCFLYHKKTKTCPCISVNFHIHYFIVFYHLFCVHYLIGLLSHISWHSKTCI